MALDSSSIPTDAFWYLISTAWLTEWNKFKCGGKHLSILYTMFECTLVSGPPGPIDNNNLLEQNGRPKPNLSRGFHYRGINERLWNYFYTIYGGGPVLKSRFLDIHSSDLSIIHYRDV